MARRRTPAWAMGAVPGGRLVRDAGTDGREEGGKGTKVEIAV